MLQNDDQLQSALGRLEDVKRASEQMRQRTEQATFKVSPKNKLFTLTVGGRGELQSLVFRGDSYRELPPAELADLLVTTLEQARKQSAEAALQGFGQLSDRAVLPMAALAEATSVDDFMNTVIEATRQALPDNRSVIRTREAG